MNENQLIELGWKLVHQYPHDQYHTNRYQLGCMEIEFTYEGEKLINKELTIREINTMQISNAQLKTLTKFFSKWEG